ncbi:cation diffusion facilitator family transporter [Pseudooceanicola onchidii]|uniref:cation diffusion facilitator family transporter n=1 Tax=Pseudooceanicola onchidii TaxID=2562279 RepID=UPI0010AB2BC1|nr:cation diffusion facilitator family transporter [Pseudooceanicola onchidii]
MTRTQKAALASVAVGLLVFAIKLWAWLLTGSVALYSDALESTINVVAALAVFVALRVAARPADDNHPYGHHKAEYLSAVFEGVLVVIAALMILREAYAGLIHPEPLRAPVLGLVINGAASVLNALWAVALLRWGRAWRSPALVADGRHILTDVWTSVGVIIGIALATVTGQDWLDPALAALVAVNILWTGWKMVREATGGLMDELHDPALVDDLQEIIRLSATGAIEAHDIRIRIAGAMTFIDFHLIVDRDMPVSEAHDICDRIEGALKIARDGKAIVTIHVEPDHKAKNEGVMVG